MTLILNIRKDQIEARKARNALAATLLTTLIGEAVMIAKNDQRENPTDMEVQNVIKKFLKGISETIAVLAKGDPAETEERLKVVNAEKDILEGYLPKQLTEDELKAIVREAIVNGAKEDMGALMGVLKKNHAGRYDGKLASAVIRDALAK
jgi:uncharacterized protein YqeY